MIEEQDIFSTATDLEDAQRQILELHRQLAELKAQNRAMWALLAEISRRLQTSSTSIKAAVSSLLDYDIFWDGSTQHEFLETIDDSVDQGADLIMLLMLAFRSEANSLEMKPESHPLQEILSTVLDALSTKMPKLHFDVTSPTAGKPVLVDYGYLAVGLRLLLEVLIESGIVSPKLELQAVEVENYWYLDVVDIQEPVTEAIDHLCQGRFDDLMLVDHISPENVLKLFTATRIIRLQNIRLDVQVNEEEKMRLRLTIPTALMT
jgi:signal transduction histidine kinase